MATFPLVPQVATAVNYPAGTDPWAATPTKVVPDSDHQTNGWTPNKPIPAQFENYDKAQIIAVIDDLQKREAIGPVVVGLDNLTNGFMEFMPSLGVFCSIEGKVAHGTYPPAVTQYSPDLKRTVSAAMANPLPDAPGPQTLLTGYYSGTVAASAACFLPLGAGGTSQSKLAAIHDTNARTQDNDTVPGASDIYDMCGDLSTGRLILVRAGGIASGIPTALNNVAITGWASDTSAVVATRAGETRAWYGGAKTVGTLAGGVTFTGVGTQNFNGLGPLPGLPTIQCTPEWDPANNRWICTTADFSSYAQMFATATIWTSPDGVAWTTLATSPRFVFVKYKAIRGWLYAIGICIDSATVPGHGGLEIFVSKDGGATWARPGVVLSYVPLATAIANLSTYAYLRGLKISLGKSSALFQCVLNSNVFTPGALQGLEYVSIRFDLA